jgi:hypothetical protein
MSILSTFIRWIATAALLATPFTSRADPVKLPAGMSVELELQHHVNSAYIPAGSPIYFRVAKDVKIDDHVLIRAGTLAIGRMDQAQKRGMVGHSGSMLMSIKVVPAIDGTAVAVDADMAKQGRSRVGATVAWTLFWGVPGLITKGVNPYLERGQKILAAVVADTIIDPDKATAPEKLPDPGTPFEISKYTFDWSKSTNLKFDIERDKDLKTVTFSATPPPGLTVAKTVFASLRLIAVDGIPVPEAVSATASTDHSATFDGWSIVRFCRDGVTELRFRGTTPDGGAIDGVYLMRIKVQKKG